MKWLTFIHQDLSHDLRYALDGNKMRELGWTPDATVVERLRDVTAWTLQNGRWL